MEGIWCDHEPAIRCDLRIGTQRPVLGFRRAQCPLLSGSVVLRRRSGMGNSDIPIDAGRYGHSVGPDSAAVPLLLLLVLPGPSLLAGRNGISKSGVRLRALS